MNLITIQIEKPETINFILGQSHFIKTVEDVHGALVNTVTGIKFGLAFCEASGKCLVRWSGNDPAMIEIAQNDALAISAGHSFIVFLAEGFYPVNVLNVVVWQRAVDLTPPLLVEAQSLGRCSKGTEIVLIGASELRGQFRRGLINNDAFLFTRMPSLLGPT